MPKSLKKLKNSYEKASGKAYSKPVSLKQKGIFLFFFIFLFIIGLYIQNMIAMLASPVRLYSSINLKEVFFICLTKRPLAMILTLLMSNTFSYFLSQRIVKDLSENTGDFVMSKKKTHGVNERMGADEKRRAYELRPYFQPSGIILAKDKETGELITVPWKYADPNEAPPNGNMLIMGDSGSRKSTGVLIGCIYSCIEHGCTIVCTDPKGELYGETVAAAIAKGYKVKVLNLIGNHFQYSDGYDILKSVRESSAPEEVVNIIVNQIVKNIGSAEDNFWNDMNTNLLRLIILAVAIGENYVPMTSTDNAAKGRTFREVMELLSSENLDEKLSALMVTDFNRKYLNDKYITWSNHSQKDSIRAGLASKLGMLKSDNLLRILSEDEIDFKKINEEKTVLYIIASDKDDTYKPILSLVTAMLFREVMEYADEQPQKKLDRPFYAFFEEFKNVGYIPDLATKIAVTRSRNINMIFCYQNIGQMKDQYGSLKGGKYEWLTIASSCSVQLCCGTNDELTAEYFQNRTGDMSVIRESHSRSVNTLVPKAIRFVPEAQERQEIASQKGYLASEIMSMSKEQILITASKRNSTMEEKYYYKHHPLYQYQAVNKSNQIIMPSPDDHIPEWKKREMKRDALRITGRDVEIPTDEITVKFFKNHHKTNIEPEKKSRLSTVSDTISNFSQMMYEEATAEQERERRRRGSIADVNMLLESEEQAKAPIVKSETEDQLIAQASTESDLKENSTIEEPAGVLLHYQPKEYIPDYYEDLF